mmetsp:Transcript_12649/g.19012  ORF Transcript_12649/g.19012 Transcript_12649/m.19012 type:complete len:81 (-) Transcript_12649:7-249(-)
MDRADARLVQREPREKSANDVGSMMNKSEKQVWFIPIFVPAVTMLSSSGRRRPEKSSFCLYLNQQKRNLCRKLNNVIYKI